MNNTHVHNRSRTGEFAPETALSRLAELGRELGSERIFEDASELAKRVAEGRFYVAFIGQFKRGKSTLLNALLQDPILPTRVLPVTTVPTVVRYGTPRGTRIRFRAGSWQGIPPAELTEYVSEENNPENRKDVVGVEVFCPSPLLADGMCFVDTPGLGSIFGGNTAATHAFVPHIDAAVVVVGADPPIAGEELKLVEDVGKQVHALVIVLNKADRTSESEREIAKSFTRDILEKRLNRPIGVIYEISGQERLEHRGPERDWANLVATLQTLARESRAKLVRSAGERGLQRVSEELLAITAEERQALLRPIERSQEHIKNLRQTIAQAEQALRDIGYLFMAEQRRLSDMFLDQRKVFLAEVMPKASAEFAAAFATLPRSYGPGFRRDAMRLAQQIAASDVLPWLEAEQARAEAEYKKSESRFVQIGNGFLRQTSESAVPELARMTNALDADKGFRVPSRFTFQRLLHVAQPASPLRYVADLFLGVVRLYSVIEKDAQEFLDHLIDMNSTRVQSDIVDRVQESRGQLETDIRKLLHEVTLIAERALEHARATRAQGKAAVEAVLAGLEAIEQEVLSLRDSRLRADHDHTTNA